MFTQALSIKKPANALHACGQLPPLVSPLAQRNPERRAIPIGFSEARTAPLVLTQSLAAWARKARKSASSYSPALA